MEAQISLSVHVIFGNFFGQIRNFVWKIYLDICIHINLWGHVNMYPDCNLYFQRSAQFESKFFNKKNPKIFQRIHRYFVVIAPLKIALPVQTPSQSSPPIKTHSQHGLK